MKRHTTREDTQMANKDMKGCPTSLALEKCKLMRYHYIPIKKANVEPVTIPNTGENVEKPELSDIVGGKVKCCGHSGK